MVRSMQLNLPTTPNWIGKYSTQSALRWTMPGPDTSYSGLVIHISAEVLSDAQIEPPIHTEYLRSGGAVIVTVIALGTRALSSFSILVSMPGYMVVPPDSTMFSYKSLRTSTSVFMIELNDVKCTPGSVLPSGCASNRASGQRKRSLPMVMTLPSGSSYVFSKSSSGLDISASKSSAT